ncbi:hypothetical protein ACFP2F_08420 [Hymenobacter artigasi]|uniref:Secreted protein n=1 Tax=Hymenobacter artigasi TaxID=2719616 RepID=A0ABX1HGA1_9BACT|nr:hypothetical protein [Hymenobacter artigasi]NKI89278.1 hypothetical protein [Hymenobacter artigasi]
MGFLLFGYLLSLFLFAAVVQVFYLQELTLLAVIDIEQAVVRTPDALAVVLGTEPVASHSACSAFSLPELTLVSAMSSVGSVLLL